jgi:hypothetical protein
VLSGVANQFLAVPAHRINEGHMPDLPGKDAQSDFYFIDRAEPE